MNARKIITQLQTKYPSKTIIKNPPDNPTEIICEIEPTKKHPEYSIAIAVIDKIKPHYHKKTIEVYEVVNRKLTAIKNSKEIGLKKGDKLTIKPGEVHSAYGNEVWIKVFSKPGWTPEDHFLVENEHVLQ